LFFADKGFSELQSVNHTNILTFIAD